MNFNIKHLVKIADAPEVNICEFFKYETMTENGELFLQKLEMDTLNPSGSTIEETVLRATTHWLSM